MMTETAGIKVYGQDKTKGYFSKSLSSEERKKLFQIPNHELLGPALRRANLFFHYRSTILCIYEKWGSWFVLGDVLYSEDVNAKSRGVDREACFQLLYHHSAELSKNVLGYYINLPILFLEFKCHQLGYSHQQDLSQEYLVGAEAEEIRRAINFQARESVYDIESGHYADLNETQKSKVKDLYQKFIQRQKPPYIGYLLAKPKDEIKEEEFFIKASNTVGDLALISGFRNLDVFYVDRLAKTEDSKMSLDVLMAFLYEELKAYGIKRVSLGLSSFFGEPKKKWEKFRKLIRFWYDAEALRSFKRKYSEQEIPSYYFVEKRKSHLWQFIKLSFISVYLKL